MTVSPQNPAPEPFDFERELYELVRDTAPRLFAVVVESGIGTEDRDAVVIAWGLAYEDGKAEVTQVGGGRRWRLEAADHVMRFVRRSEGCAPRLVWLAPAGDNGQGQEQEQEQAA
ncbi:hypothetical protein [Streptomyces sp. NPDC088261]|uniref:hypothetical protein n=1 Tax=Streptomyces sp. NPDC088261 TaxID=3365851 RepID=UPI0038078B92